jgi:hypothetical protein
VLDAANNWSPEDAVFRKSEWCGYPPPDRTPPPSAGTSGKPPRDSEASLLRLVVSRTPTMRIDPAQIRAHGDHAAFRRGGCRSICGSALDAASTSTRWSKCSQPAARRRVKLSSRCRASSSAVSLTDHRPNGVSSARRSSTHRQPSKPRCKVKGTRSLRRDQAREDVAGVEALIGGELRKGRERRIARPDQMIAAEVVVAP